MWKRATPATPMSTRLRALGARARRRPAACGIASRQSFGGAHDPLQSLYLVIARETLARHSGLADFAFTMQGLGSGPITLAGRTNSSAAICRASPRAPRSPPSH